jgi:alkylation response protein AidB-like acyl-CoA dehydrogenase
MLDPTAVAEGERRASGVEGDALRAVELARSLSGTFPLPGAGSTPTLFALLAGIAVADLTAARIVEAHLDARAILAQAGADPVAATWGVFAAEAPGVRLDARHGSDGWTLTGTKPWCSVAGLLDRALVTAHTGDGHRRLFDVSLREPGVVVREGGWAARGLREVPSGPVDFDEVSAEPVGADQWYLERPGFAWGGMGVAACWWGGSVGLARRLYRAATDREPDEIALMHLGAVDVTVVASGNALDAAGRAIDDGRATGREGTILAARVRSLVADTVDEVIARAGNSLGPSPLANEEDHARRVADLGLYVRQHHAERDQVALGRQLLASGVAPW